MEKQYSFKTFGCKVNTHDSALIQKSLKEKGWSHKVSSFSKDGHSLHVINTCAVTESAVKEALRHIRHYRKNHPKSCIVVTGCATQVETERFAHLKEVDLVVSNSHKGSLTDILQKTFHEHKTQAPLSTQTEHKPQPDLPLPKVFKSSIFKNPNMGKGESLEAGHTRCFLKIQDGCNSFCTFCIIPFARGKSRSLSVDELVRSVQTHYDQGVREVVLTGVHIGDYKDPKDQQKTLPYLVSALLKHTNLPRIRLSSLEPIELNEELLDLFSDSRVCSHFHLSVQSAHSDVLKSMKRKYKAEDVERALKSIHKKIPEAFVGMDIIAGFSKESQQEFEDTYEKLKNWPWTKLHVFPYSPRRDTYAEKMYPPHSRSLIMKRAMLLRHLSLARFKQALKAQVGTVKQVLPLKHKEQRGLSRDYWPFTLPAKHKVNKAGEVQMYVKAVDEKTGHLIGHSNP